MCVVLSVGLEVQLEVNLLHKDFAKSSEEELLTSNTIDKCHARFIDLGRTVRDNSSSGRSDQSELTSESKLDHEQNGYEGFETSR